MAIDYNTDILQFYASRLETDPSYIQELATVTSRGYPDRDVTEIGLDGDNFQLNTGTVTGTGAGAGPTLDEWLVDIKASTDVLNNNLDASIVKQDNGEFIIVIEAADLTIPVDITTVEGTDPDKGLKALGIPEGTVKSGGELGLGRADQKKEQRLLTTLGVLISHLRLMKSRSEARNLHFILSRIATGVGSGGFVYDDQSSSVRGNVRNPNYKVNDSMLIKLVHEAEGVVKNTFDFEMPSVTNYDLDDLVTLINNEVSAASATTDNLEAFNDRGYLKLVSLDGYTISIQQGAATSGTAGQADDLTTKSGLEFEDNRSKRNEVAEKVKEEALDYFDTNRRSLSI